MRIIIYRVSRLKRSAGCYLNSRPLDRWVCVGFFRARNGVDACKQARTAIGNPLAIVRVDGVATRV